jgi:hypothetical protein
MWRYVHDYPRHNIGLAKPLAIATSSELSVASEMPTARKKFGRIHYAGETPRDEAYGPIPTPNGAPRGIAFRLKQHPADRQKNSGARQKANDGSVSHTRKPVEIPQLQARIERSEMERSFASNAPRRLCRHFIATAAIGNGRLQTPPAGATGTNCPQTQSPRPVTARARPREYRCRSRSPS